jgi:epoxyqueuosine reductase
MQTSISEELSELTDATESGEALKVWLKEQASELGFDAFGVAHPAATGAAVERLRAFLAAGHHGDMNWMERNADRRGSPLTLWPEVRSIIMLGMNYGPAQDPLAVLAQRHRGAISVYAQGSDYHDVVKGRLKRLASALARRAGADVKVFVDTAPVMEKPLAQAAGLGWQGKHTNLVSRELGSWLFLGAIFTTAHLPSDQAESDHCGSCHACIDVCPTKAFPAPYRLDARRCVSYLTIEHRGQIAREFREPMGNRIYGCDDCLAVCPWNKFARTAAEARFHARESSNNPPLAGLLDLDDAAFRARFAGSPIKRTGRNRFIRNVLVAAGNSRDASLGQQVERLLGDASPLVRGMAIWAIRRLADAQRVDRLKHLHLADERDESVRHEWLEDEAT